ncbi:PLP-dependent transferase [Periconia macrospinosa]|uniref:PLP-dependent transferase n=1 Tax=Periconia macrospinosa TaxID=97972 RepID=A0A2V1E4B9_9PLEO|nr:PLP-dependent transferase [Periconia macrospinosa]
MDSSQFREAAYSAIDESNFTLNYHHPMLFEKIVQYYDTLTERPVLPSISPGYLKPLLPPGPPSEGEPWPQIQADIEKLIQPGLTHWQHPKYMAFFPANASYPGIIGEMYSSTFTAAAFNWICSPAITELETIVLDWIAKMIALPECFLSDSPGGGGGIIQGTASEVIVTAVVAARERMVRKLLTSSGFDPTSHETEEALDLAATIRGKLVALGGEHAHSSTQKAAIIAGTRFRTVPAPQSSNFAVTASALRSTIEACKAKGLEPYYFTATLGSTATCAVDDLEGIAAVARDYPDIWIHVDAAYAGSALICDEYQHLTPPMQHFASFNFNLHKWLLVNFDCSAFYVQCRKDLTDTFSITPAYLRNSYTESGLVTDYRDWQIPLGRRFRSLKVWFVLRTYGVEGLKRFIRGGIKLGEYFNGLLDSRKDLFTVVTPAAFALTTFQVKPESSSTSEEEKKKEEANRLTKAAFEIVDKKQEFFLTSTVVNGVYIIRLVSANERAEEKYVKQVFEALVAAAEEKERR